MKNRNEFSVRFWGVRGTVPVAGALTRRYGGNTSCVELRCAGRIIIFDAGTGLKLLGDVLAEKQVDILISHTHIDHIIGLPFFMPAYDASRHLRLWAGHLLPEHTLREVIGQLMRPPLFPLTPEKFKARVQYNDFIAGDDLNAPFLREDGIRIKTLPLNHPDRATAYRVEYAGKSVCYVTDYEHKPKAIDKALVRFVGKADILIYDSTYDDKEFRRYSGWGHSTWQQGARIAKAAGVKMFVAFHHDPGASDEVLNKRAMQLKKICSGWIFAKEGMKLSLL